MRITVERPLRVRWEVTDDTLAADVDRPCSPQSRLPTVSWGMSTIASPTAPNEVGTASTSPGFAVAWQSSGARISSVSLGEDCARPHLLCLVDLVVAKAEYTDHGKRDGGQAQDPEVCERCSRHIRRIALQRKRDHIEADTCDEMAQARGELSGK